MVWGVFICQEDTLPVPEPMPGDTQQSIALTQPTKVHDTKPARRATSSLHPVGVYGATGYAGQVLMNILARHPNVRVAFATSESSKESVEGLGLVAAADAPLDSVEAVFLCLPNGASGATAAKAVAAGVKVVDFSADLRLDSVDVYKKWYGMDNPAPHLLPAPFGLPEINRAKLAGAKYIANPGCHVTATLLALYPLAKAGALTADPIISDTKTGVS